jgi:hypothetical protein
MEEIETFPQGDFEKVDGVRERCAQQRRQDLRERLEHLPGLARVTQGCDTGQERGRADAGTAASSEGPSDESRFSRERNSVAVQAIALKAERPPLTYAKNPSFLCQSLLKVHRVMSDP